MRTKKLIGGKYLGKGSYGCVITPPLSCNKTQRNNKINSSKSYSSVSKIIIKPDEDSIDELKISSLIKKFDPKQIHFITYDSYCNVKQVPNNRNNTVKVKYSNSSQKHYYSIDNKGKLSKNKKDTRTNDDDSHKCLIDLSLKPINIIMPYGGYDLFDLKHKFNDKYKKYLNYKKKFKVNDNLNKYFYFIKTYEMFRDNFKSCFKNLVLGLYKLHKFRIVNRDIKIENIMANYNIDTKNVQLRYIDFGLSQYLSPQHSSNYYNITLSGTEQVIPPELFITYIMHDYKYNSKYVETNKTNIKNYSNNDIIYIKKMMKDINYDIEKNVIETLESFKEYEYVDNMYEIKKTKANYNTKYKLPILEKIYNDIKKHYDEKTILNAYFGTKNVHSLNGYLQKADVYGLGCAMYEFCIYNSKFININSKQNFKLHNLLKKMVNPDPEFRYNVLQCLKHPYFRQ